MKLALAPVLALSVVALAGCMLANATPAEKLRDAVVGYNEACRWSRFDLAIEHVDGPARASFQRDHGRWGRTISIADLEVVSVNAAGTDGATRAVSVVTNHWYTSDATYVHSTTLRQEWRKERTNFFLEKEEVVDGDGAIFDPLPGVATPPTVAPPASGDATASAATASPSTVTASTATAAPAPAEASVAPR